MPWLSTPRSRPCLIWNALPPSSAGGSAAPTSAVGTLMPGFTLGAPHTMVSVLPVPASTWHTVSLSALGWRSTDSTSPTTTPVNGGAAGRSSSTSMPALVSRSASWVVVSGGLQNSRSHDSGNCMAEGSDLLELGQEAQVAVEEQAQVADAVAQHRQAIDARAEGEADEALGIEPHVADDLRMDLARARHLEPPAFQRAALEHDVDLGAGLGEREVAGAKAQREVGGLEEGLDEVEVHRLQVLEAHVVADPQALDLVEHRRVRGVAVDAVRAARGDDADVGHGRRAGVLAGMGAGVAQLHRRRVRAQGEPAAFGVLHVDVERVLHRSRGMVLGVVERGEAHPVGLDLGTVGHIEAHRREDLLDALHRARDRMHRAATALAAGQGDVERFGAQLGLEL